MKSVPGHGRPGERVLTLADLAVRAGQAILEVDSGSMAVSRKGDSTPVTEADRRAEEVILSGLARVLPELPVISEEAAAGGKLPEVGDRFALVDPLDGTREFIAGRAEFTVNIALVEGGRAVCGVVHAPALGIIALAEAGGAFEARLGPGLDLRSAEWRSLTTRRVPTTGLIALASRSHRDAETDAFLASRGVAEIRSAGSSLKFIVLARGEADLYPRFGRTMEWDTAAGHAVLSAAGGIVVTADGAELSYGKRGVGYANPAFVAWGSRPPQTTF